eukprot:15453302-Alexandrium_andersonii.AAC.1
MEDGTAEVATVGSAVGLDGSNRGLLYDALTFPAPPSPNPEAPNTVQEAPPPPAPSLEQPERQVLDGSMHLISPGPWGCFRITAKQPLTSDRSHGTGKFGGFEASCPWHKNTKTGCKRFFASLGPDESSYRDSLVKCMFWCVQARSVARQWQH